MPTFHRYLLSLFISLAGSSFVGAQCGTQWSPDYRVPGTGVDAPVRASANWDPDGVGPLARTSHQVVDGAGERRAGA